MRHQLKGGNDEMLLLQLVNFNSRSKVEKMLSMQLLILHSFATNKAQKIVLVGY